MADGIVDDDINEKSNEIEFQFDDSAQHHDNLVFVFKDEYLEKIQEFRSDALGICVAGISENFTSRTKLPVAMLKELVDVLGDLIEGAVGIYIKPAIFFLSGTASPGAAVFSENLLLPEVLYKINIFATTFLYKLARAQNPNSKLELHEILEPNTIEIFDAAAARTLNKVGGTRLTQGIVLQDYQGSNLAIMSGTLRNSKTQLPELKEYPARYCGFIDGHSVARRFIALDINNKIINIDADFDLLYDQITNVLQGLRLKVNAEVAEWRRGDDLISVQLKSIELSN
jgi:hypothetical protein